MTRANMHTEKIHYSQLIREFGIIFLFLVVSSGAWANMIRVKANATGANDGNSWANAYIDLQAALAIAQWGDEIWVAAGVYKPTNGTDRTKSFVMTAGVAIYGGFAGDETTRGQRDWAAHPTILSGDIGVQGNSSDNSCHVVAGGFSTVLDGFTITGGTAGYNNGGGMINDSVSPTVANCTFSGNTAVGGCGGGMYNISASPTITNCTFSGNSGDCGGMYIASGSPILTNCTFSGNSTTYMGGGIYIASGSPTLTNCTFSGNSSTGIGGGIYIAGGSPIVTNCTFSGNTANSGGGIHNDGSSTVINCIFSGNMASNDGGGLYCVSLGSTTVINCTFSGNSATNKGGGMYNDGPSGPTVTNCTIWGNSATLGPEVYKSGGPSTFRHCAIKGSGGSGTGWNSALGTDGGGNIMSDPLFVNATSPAGTDAIWRTGDDGLRLQTGSPCINAGLVTGAPATDILGNSRVGAPDIGAYEFLSNPIPNPPSTPEGRLALTYTITKVSTAPAGKTVQYTYKWTSDKSGSVTHGPKTALSDTLTEMELVHAGDTWTVTVTPRYDTTTGTPSSSKVKILSAQNGVNQWTFYK